MNEQLRQKRYYALALKHEAAAREMRELAEKERGKSAGCFHEWDDVSSDIPPHQRVASYCVKCGEER